MKLMRIAVCMGLFSFLGVLRAAEQQAQDPFMGDYQGKHKTATEKKQIVAQVFPLGGGTYQANIFSEFDTRVAPIVVMEGKIADSKLVLTGKDAAAKQGEAWSGVIVDGVFTGKSPDGEKSTFSMKKKVRLSPTLGAKPPKGAIVLLGPDTKDVKVDWQRDNGSECRWELLSNGVMRVRDGGIISRKQFKNHKVHLEFKIPYEPEKRGQDRGNSGMYLQGRYEVQVLDSYGLEGKIDDCGAIYSIEKARVNMSAPPLQWQTYDATLQAAEMDGDKVVKYARVTVEHNGVKVHENLELPHPTTAAPFGNIAATGGLYLQDHGHPVEFRNIWVVELP